MKNNGKNIIIVLGALLGLYLFWPLIKGVLTIVLAAVLVFVVYVLVQSKKEKQKIVQDPVQHFAKQRMKQDILEAEYIEREIKE